MKHFLAFLLLAVPITKPNQLKYNANATGSVDRQLSSKLGDTVSVKDFGAVGDGVTDDSTAVTNAINSSGPTQYIDFGCPGTYKTSAFGTLACGDYYPPLAGITGSFPRSLPQKILDILDVKDFGAKGDGATDDKTAIQNAINYAASIGGATIYFPPATYYVASTPVVGATGDRITLLGSRGNSSITTLSGTYAHLDLQGSSGDFIQHFTISNMRFIGSGLGVQTRFTESLYVERSFFSGTQGGLYMSMNGGEQDVKTTIIGNRFDNVGSGIQSGDTRVADINIAFNYFVDNTVRALNLGYIDGGAIVYNKIFNTLSSGTENDGIQILRPVYLKLEGNDVFQVNGYGIRLSSPRRSRIVGNTVIATGLTNKKSAFVVLQYPAITPELNEIRDNKIYQSYGSGFDLSILTNSNVDGNKIIGAGQGGAVYDAILCTSCVGVRLRENFIDGQSATRYWLNLTTSTNMDLGAGNTYTATLQADLFRSGANSMQIAWNAIPALPTTTYTATFLDSVILADATSAGFTVNLPSAAACAGKEYEIVKTDTSANAVTVDPASTQTIDGALTVPLSFRYAKMRIVSDGANWLTQAAGTLQSGTPILLTAQVADKAATNVYASAPAGEYRVCATARTTTSGTGTTANLNIIWTDEGGAKTDAVGTWALNSVTVTGQINKCEYIHVAATTNIQVSVTAGTYGTSAYALSATVERVN